MSGWIVAATLWALGIPLAFDWACECQFDKVNLKTLNAIIAWPLLVISWVGISLIMKIAKP